MDESNQPQLRSMDIMAFQTFKYIYISNDFTLLNYIK